MHAHAHTHTHTHTHNVQSHTDVLYKSDFKKPCSLHAPVLKLHFEELNWMGECLLQVGKL